MLTRLALEHLLGALRPLVLHHGSEVTVRHPAPHKGEDVDLVEAGRVVRDPAGLAAFGSRESFSALVGAPSFLPSPATRLPPCPALDMARAKRFFLRSDGRVGSCLRDNSTW